MRTLLSTLLLLLALCAPILAKPMPGPSLEDAVKASPVIVVANFRSYETGRVDYLKGTKATYQVTRVLKGEVPPAKTLRLAYAFHDGSACLAPEGWSFTPSMMPKAGSSWILLLQLPGTYRGDFGRLPATEANLKKVGLFLSKE